ncbi:MAG: zinc-dependent metalloprotease [Gemmatimonadota bacterium]
MSSIPTRGRTPTPPTPFNRPCRLPMGRLLGLVLAAGLLLAPSLLEAQERDYGEVVPSGAESREGLFDVHQVEDQILFEIPDSIQGRDMIIMSRYHRTQQELADVGAMMTSNIVVRWEEREGRILMRAVSHSTTAEEGSNIAMAVDNQAFPPVIAAFPIEARGSGTAVIDVTDLYMGDHPTFSLPRNQRSELAVRSYERDRSWLEFVKTFPINVEVRVVRTYAADEAPSTGRGGAVSFEVNHSMILLDEEPMMPRLADERVTYITTSRVDYSRDFQGVRPYEYLRRFRLEPSDPEAFARGELVDPVEPIVWYIDPATPAKWIPYFEAGVMEWEAAFEEAGFSNALDVRVAPTEEEDPEFSLLDARYSVIRYVPTMVRSANAGGDVVDPRSGEVIRGHINMYHGLMERLRWWLVSQVATANPDFRTDELSEEDMGEALRYVVSHEMAHALGLPHNQRANFVYPVDSLRSPEFVERMGHSASSVGRTRYNYVAQPGDGVPPERRVGVWDIFAIMWGYRPIPEATSPEEEFETLNEWIVERAHLPWFRSATAQFGMDVEWDPYRMTEGISDDPVRAAEFGMQNLRTATESLMDWVLSPGDDYYELETHYLQNLTQWNRYAEHAAAAVGGSWTHYKRFGEEGWVYTPIERDYQLAAMQFLDEHVLQTPHWALDIDMLRRLEHAGAVERIRAYQELAVQRFLNHARLARMIEHEAFLGEDTYGPAEMLDDAREIVWRELQTGAEIDTYRRNQQRAYLDQSHYLLLEAESDHWSPPGSGNLRVSSNNDPPLNADLHIGQSDIRPLVRDQLRLLRDEVQGALDGGVADRMSRIHLEDALIRIDQALGG